MPTPTEILERNYTRRYKIFSDMESKLGDVPLVNKLARRCLVAGDKLRKTNYSGKFPEWKSAKEDFAESVAKIRDESQKENHDPVIDEMLTELGDMEDLIYKKLEDK